MKTILFAVAVGLVASPVLAGPMCYNSTPQEDAQVADIAQRQGTTPQAVIDKNMQNEISSGANAIVVQSVGTALANQWPSMTNAKKTNICTQLGVSPCPP